MGEYLMPFLTGAVGAAIASGVFGIVMYRMKRKDELEDRNSDIKLALRMLMYDRIKEQGKEYIARGSITSEELDDLIKMHTVYHNNLEGNGFLDNLMQHVKQLQIKD